jgi:TPR repeat protein
VDAHAGLGGGAAALLTTALELGHAPAGIALARIYLDGEGVAPDAARARRYLGRAAQLGDGAALRRLGAMHEAGQGGPGDLAAAFVLYQEAVNLGDVPAAVELARFMQAHDGYWRDPPLAYAYCLWAAAQAADDARAEAHAETCRALGAEMTRDQRKEGRRLLQQF